jgi:hypothetical protein
MDKVVIGVVGEWVRTAIGSLYPRVDAIKGSM